MGPNDEIPNFETLDYLRFIESLKVCAVRIFIFALIQIRHNPSVNIAKLT